MATLRSMTGFARARRHHSDGEISVTVKSVNHRGLDVQVWNRTPAKAARLLNNKSVAYSA